MLQVTITTIRTIRNFSSYDHELFTQNTMALFLVRVWFAIAACIGCQAQLRDVKSATPNGYLRFFANDSYIGQPVPCTEKEKRCLRFNLLHDESPRGFSGCVTLNMYLFVNRTEFFNGSGHLVVADPDYSEPCDWNGGRRFAYDRVCYTKELVRDVICACGGQPGSDIAKNPTTTHLFGGQECRCQRTIPTHIAQPEEPGRCLIPNLSFPDAVHAPFTQEQGFSITLRGAKEVLPPVGLQCDMAQLRCFRLGQVAFGSSCVQLLQQGPCPTDHVVALNVSAAQKRLAETTCVHVRGNCPVDHVRMTFDGRCYSKRELEFLVGSYIGPNQFGLIVIIREAYSFPPKFTPQVFQSNLCYINVTVTIRPSPGEYPAGLPAAKPDNCGKNDDEACKLHDVKSEPPQPDP